MGCPNLSRVVRAGFTEEVAEVLEKLEVSHADARGKALSQGRGTCKCESPEAGLCLGTSRSSKEPTAAGIDGMRSKQWAMRTGGMGNGDRR